MDYFFKRDLPFVVIETAKTAPTTLRESRCFLVRIQSFHDVADRQGTENR